MRKIKLFWEMKVKMFLIVKKKKTDSDNNSINSNNFDKTTIN